jgi:adenylate cyclase
MTPGQPCEARTLGRLNVLRRELIDPAIAAHSGRIVKLMGDGALVEFASAVDVSPVRSRSRDSFESTTPLALKAIQSGFGSELTLAISSLRVGDGVNVAARIEGIAEPGGISISEEAWRQVQGKVAANFVDAGEQSLKNIARPVRVYRLDLTQKTASASQALRPTHALPDEPSIAVLAFNNTSGDPEQEYFSDGISEDIITDLSKLSELHVIARNSSFTYKGQAGRRGAGWPRSRRALCTGRQRAEGGQQGPRYRPAHRRRERCAYLGRSLRSRPH